MQHDHLKTRRQMQQQCGRRYSRMPFKKQRVRRSTMHCFGCLAQQWQILLLPSHL